MKISDFHNDVIDRLARIEVHGENTNKHLILLNGQTGKNTTFRLKVLGVLKLIGVLMIPILFIIIRKYI